MSQGCERDRPNPMWSNQWTNGKVGDFNNTLVLPGSARAASWFTLREYTYKNHKAGFQFLETFYPAIQQEIREVSPWGVLKLSSQYLLFFLFFFLVAVPRVARVGATGFWIFYPVSQSVYWFSDWVTTRSSPGEECHRWDYVVSYISIGKRLAAAVGCTMTR